jgi:wyosine [tRNA(Phe)-imidazoG37] synthetase (radical SAM superfamily)
MPDAAPPQGNSALAFGPIPSRRLGRSLGVNNIPAKICTYSCVYCQVGRTTAMPLERRAYYAPEEVFAAVQAKLENARRLGAAADYVTFVPDGEPTLDANLGAELDLLRPLGVPLAAISNASLISREDVRADLSRADWVSLKADAVDEATWRRLNRPHGKLRLEPILAGVRAFAREFRGTLATETMLVRGVNEAPGHVEAVAALLAEVKPATAYLAVPTRPPAAEAVEPPTAESVARAYEMFVSAGLRTELLLGYPTEPFAYTGDVEADILSITAVHPMREEAVAELLAKAGAGREAVERLVAAGLVAAVEFEGRKFFVRRFEKGVRDGGN